MTISQTYSLLIPHNPEKNFSFSHLRCPRVSHTFSAKERDTETGYSYFGSRYYNSDLSIWLSVDPMSEKYPSLSSYSYCANNPIKLVDPNGEEVNPIFSTSGELLGTDSKGWKGTAIVMEKRDFKNGMKHEDAMKKRTELDKYGKGINISDSDWEKLKQMVEKGCRQQWKIIATKMFTLNQKPILETGIIMMHIK
ncbi:MAG: hypothetical protein CW341_10530 [Bacteroidetes bacterium]|nr:hypothetical protein [Bacteroidota bacterium]